MGIRIKVNRIAGTCSDFCAFCVAQGIRKALRRHCFKALAALRRRCEGVAKALERDDPDCIDWVNWIDWTDWIDGID